MRKKIELKNKIDIKSKVRVMLGKKVHPFLLWLAILLFPLFIFSIISYIIIFSQSTYTNFYETHNTYETFGNKTLVLKLTTDLQNYLRGGEELDKQYYTQREILHMKDVQKIFRFCIILFSIINIYVVVMLSYLFITEQINLFSRILLHGSILSLIFLIVAIIALTTFSSSFITFHKLLFNNDFWLLPDNSTLIKLFPEVFFYSVTKKIIICYFVTVLTTLLVTLFFSRRKNAN